MQFLKYVATDLRRRFGTNLSRISVVFPNKRAGIFFDNYLLDDDSSQPIWSPRYFTIQDLFDNLSPLKPTDDIKAVCLLYKIYKYHIQGISFNNNKKNQEISLDYFYGWGTQLLKDFSDIDRSLIPAKDIFSNWSAAKMLEGLTEEEKKQLTPLTELFQAHGKLKEDFSVMWEKLFDIYTDFNKCLEEDGEAYEGARQRLAIQKLEEDPDTFYTDTDIYVFVGFNMLVPTEWKLFDTIRKQGHALFYWDYDKLYVGKQSKLTFGRAMQRNLEHFSNALEGNLFDSLSQREEPLRFIAAASNNGQTHYSTQWIQQYITKDKENRTAIVLCDEMLLQPLLHCIPSDKETPHGVHEVNITKGFPMTHTPAFHYLKKKFEKADPTLDNETLLLTLADDIQQKAQEELTEIDKQTWIGQLTAESYFQCYTCLNRLRTFVEQGILIINRKTLQGLFFQIATTLNVPFHGEPATGLQILGMLETRNLDFDSLLILSAEEGIMPTKRADRSFIPYDLRKHYGIVTNDEQTEVYAYNFFRLLQHSKHVTILYNNTTDGEHSKGEMSRFMLQILTQTNIPVLHYILNEKTSRISSTVKPPTPAEALAIMQDRQLNLSASAINEYITCSMKYYLHHILGIQEKTEESELLPQNIFGNIFHKAMELIYQKFKEATETQSNPSQYLYIETANLSKNDMAINEYILEAFRHVIENEKKHTPDADKLYDVQRHKIEIQILNHYIKKILTYDSCLAKNNHLQILDLEKNIHIHLDDKTSLNGFIDRIDTIDDIVRIVDYKTGNFNSKKIEAKDIDELFTNKDKNYVFQTLFYELLYHIDQGENANSALYFTQKIGNPDFSPNINIKSLPATEPKLNYFLQKLKQHIDSMRTNPFQFTPISNICNKCTYKSICGR